jgi:Xaa-Pro aminopeptidase
MDTYARRRQRLARPLKADHLDALLVTQPVNVTYLTGFTGDSSFLVVAPKRAILVSDDRFRGQIQDECPEIETHIRPHNVTPLQAIADAAAKLGVRDIGFESTHLTVASHEFLKSAAKAVNWSPQAGRVEQLRAIKDAGELRAIRGAIRVAEKAFGVLRATLSPADSEKDLADAMETYVRKAGGECCGFPPIMAVGERSALPHCPPTARTVAQDGWLLVDWGAKAGQYNSDLTRVLVVPEALSQPGRRGKVETRLEKLYTVALSAQRAAAQAARPGSAAKDVDAAARQVIAAAGYGENFTHGLGHGVGLQLHEAPAVRENSNDVLQAGMVITIEPGIYIPGWGGVRVEDDFLITPDGCERLTTVPNDSPLTAG